MKERIPDRAFEMMSLIMKIMEAVHPNAEKRVGTFGVKAGMTIVDYGCGPGRYIAHLARLAGPQGKVFGVDISKAALEEIEKQIELLHLNNVEFCLAKGYDNGLEPECADMIVALDMFFMIEQATKFLKELNRICKKDGVLIIDDGHAPRARTKEKLNAAGVWLITEETKDHLTCAKKLQR